MISFGIVGAGWRAVFYLRVARACPDKFKVIGMVTRDRHKAARLTEQFGVPLFGSVDELLAGAQPFFMVTSVPVAVNPGVIGSLVKARIPVLSETPPAATLQELTGLWALVKDRGRVQVAEQYWLQPHYAARLAFIRTGKLGLPSQAQISVAHGYHGISLMRQFLKIGFENATILARDFTTALVQSPDRSGPPAQESIVNSTQTLSWFDFGDRLGIYDFTEDQYFSYMRGPRLLVRGERGEIVNDTAVYLQDFRTPILVAFTRHSAGEQGSMEGHYLKGIQAGEEWVYHNPLAPGELTDDEVAVGTCLLKMAEYAQGGPPFYSLAQGCQDRYLDLMLQSAQAQGQPATTETQAWADEAG